ncbi:hypothetical protein Tco_1306864 [Tanacetum coccineum]
MSTNGEMVDQDDDDLAKERGLLASLIDKLKCEIDDIKNRNKLLESSNKTLVDKLKGEIKDFKTKNKSLESSNNHFKETNNELSKTNQLIFKDLKKFQDELEKRHDISDMKKELVAHQETISIMSQQKEEQTKFYKTREEKELEKVIALENKIKSLDDTVYKTGQSVQTMNMLNHNCKKSFVKPEFLKKAQRENPRLYDIGCYNDNLALMLAPESDERIRLAQESRSKLSDLIRPFDYDKLNNLYDLFVSQREKSPEQQYFSERSKMSHTLAKNENSKESFNKHTTLLERRMDESIPEYYYADHMNAILGVYTTPDEFTDLQCEYVDQVVKCEHLEKELSKRTNNVNNKSFNELSKRFSELEQHSINLELALQQNLKAQLQDKEIPISDLKKLIEKMKGKSMETKFEKPSVIRQTNAFKSQRQSVLGLIPTTSVSILQLKSNRLEDRVIYNNSEGKKQVEDYHRNFKFSNNKMFVTACNESLNAKTSNVNFVYVTYGKCVLNDNDDMCVLHYINGMHYRTKIPMAVPISTTEPKRTVNQCAATPLREQLLQNPLTKNLEA